MDTLLQDLRYAWRSMFKQPGFTLIAVLALALGIGANTALFSVINTVLLRPLPYEVPEQLMLVRERTPQTPRMSVAYPNFLDYKERNQTFERLVSYRWRGLDLTGVSEPERVENYQVSVGFFETLGVKPLLGRVFLPEEDQPGGKAAVVLSHALWQRKFSSDAAIIGKIITLNGIAFTVIGVTPAGFQYPGRAESWTPIGRVAPSLMDRGVHQGLTVLGRLKPGVTPAQAQADLDTIARRLGEQFKATNEGVGVTAERLADSMVQDIRPALLVLLGAVGFVLLIACANVANLLLARSAARRREFAVRAAMGAGRARLVRQLLTESVLLALAGGALGLGLAYGAVKVLKAVIPAEGNVPRLQEVSLDGYVLGFTILISLLTGIVFGIVPALQTSKIQLSDAIKESGRGQGGTRRQRQVRGALVVVEVALAIIVLVGGGLMVKGFRKLTTTSPGFNASGTLVMDMALPPARYADGEKQTAFYQQLLSRLPNLPGVQAVGIVNPLPVSGTSNQSSSLPEGVPLAKENVVTSDFLVTSPGYFTAMGIPLLQGRDFTEFDNPQAALAIIVDDTTAQRFWPNQNPIGKRMGFELAENASGPPIPIYREVVGVVGHIKHNGLLESARQQIYVPYLQMPNMFRGVLPPMSLVVRANNPTGMIPAVRNTIAGLDNNIPLYNINTMEQRLADSIARNRLSALLMTSFAVVGLALAAIGIFGLMSHSVAQRTQEIGLRMALGAGRGDVLKLVIGQGMTLVGIGLAIGLVGAFLLKPILAQLVFAVSATDPWTYVAVIAGLALIALLACYLPARKAMKVDPTVALRYE